MPPLLLLLLLALALPMAPASGRPNVLFLAVDDLRNDLGCLGATHVPTPAIDRLAASGRLFTRHYVQVPTCGASRCALWRGKVPTDPVHLGNHAIRDTAGAWASDSLPARFRQAGYQTLAVGKLTHHPGGRTGRDWNEGPVELPGAWDREWLPETPWRTAQAMMHGYANGTPRIPGKSPPWEAFDGPDTAYPDAHVAAAASAELERLARLDSPWFLAVGFFKPHLPFAAPKAWHDRINPGTLPPVVPSERPAWPSGWHRSGEFRGNYGSDGRDPDTDPDYARTLRRAYAASTAYVDAQIGRVLDTLDRLDLSRNTLVVLWSDHGFLLGEHAIWGKHCLYEKALLSPLILRTPGLPFPGTPTAAVVETVDLLPTLADLCDVPAPSGLDGHSLAPQLADPAAHGTKPARSYWTGGAQSLRTDRWRLTRLPSADGGRPALELFDYATDPAESRNHAAAHPDLVASLLAAMGSGPARRSP